MSGVKLEGNALGTGVFTIKSPNSNTDRTFDLPDASGSFVTADSSGNVGIGTSSPSVKFQVNGEIRSTNGTEEVIVSGTNGSIEIVRTAGNPFIDFKSAIAEDFDCRIQQDNNGLAFSTGGNGAAPERMRIDSSGNVLLNTTSALSVSSRLQIVYNAATEGGITFKSSSSSYVVGAQTFQNASGTQVGYIYPTASSTTYSTSSDYRLKENVQPMVGALEKVAQLKPVTYKWKIDGSDGQGFIAHELQAVVPDCVTGEKDAVDADGNPVYQGIDTSFLVATLTAAIQELKAELDTVKSELATLRGTA